MSRFDLVEIKDDRGCREGSFNPDIVSRVLVYTFILVLVPVLGQVAAEVVFLVAVLGCVLYIRYYG